jgi:hypothetical protein
MIYPDFKKSELGLVKQVLKAHPEYKYNIADYDYRAYMFPQMWPNTAGGFEDGGFSGQAITEQYTLVLCLNILLKDMTTKEYYGVFFDGEPCYVVEDPKPKFFADLDEMCMKNKAEARKVY